MQDDTNPFASPPEVPNDQPLLADLAEPSGVIPYASAATRAKWAVGLLAAVASTRLLQIGFALLQLRLIGQLRTADVTQMELHVHRLGYGLLGLVMLAASIGSWVAFLMWFHRVHRNLPSLGTISPRYSPGWAVGAWFVPVLSLFRPCQIMFEVWKGSDPAVMRRSPGVGAGRTGSALVGWWWALWIIMCVGNQAAGQVASLAESPEACVIGTWLGLVAGTITLPAALVAILLVRRVTANQETRFRLLAGGEEETGPGGTP